GGVAWLSANDFAAIDLLWSRWSPGWAADPKRIAAVKHTFRQPGTATAAVAYYRQMLPNPVIGLGEYARIFRTLVGGAPSCPTLILAGHKDGCIGRELYKNLETSFKAPCTVTIVPEAGHFLHLERPAWVHAAILKHLVTSSQ
ncbi:MAG: alpha/beta fold hydrolase, partial [Nannocystaceae bacterium]